ncbi:phosphoribosylamine--glycine ligase [Alkalibacillus flavidus]|uniref:Phosphoribosylamine--glycine ligase n=1 Tax=Alkalibacillus flavidus TaxID=546021 RepID=A0ABV2KWM4_9BACI
MNVLIIGRGGREHAIACSLSQSERVGQIIVAPGNDGMRDVAHIEPIAENDHDQLIKLAFQQAIDLTIVGPEAPLMDGIVNRFQQAGLRIFGPTQEAALIEGSKDFAKRLMHDYQIPNAKYQTFTNAEAAKRYISNQGAPIVIKADGLASGKGVTVATTLLEAHQAVDAMLSGEQDEETNHRVVIEDYLEGEEFSLMAFVNGENVYPMVVSQDHKRAFDHDEGPNTGGMGAYSPVPQINEQTYHQSVQTILKPVAKALIAENRSFTGILYAGLIATSEGPKVIEFNARFGDPEAQVVLPRLQTDLVDVIDCVLDDRPVMLSWSDEAVVGVVLAALGYPASYEKGMPLQGLSNLQSDLFTFHAGTKKRDGKWVTNGGRLLLIGASGATIEQAQRHVYEQIKYLDSEHVFYRKDIANKALQKL